MKFEPRSKNNRVITQDFSTSLVDSNSRCGQKPDSHADRRLAPIVKNEAYKYMVIKYILLLELVRVPYVIHLCPCQIDGWVETTSIEPQ